MKLLLLGGTRFLGRHVVASALGRGHEVTLFHRGKTEPGLFPECERILGDREHDLDRLGRRTWDAVVDTSAFVPRIAGDSARRLAGRVGHYTFVSSISVYADPIAPGADESAAVTRLEDPATETVNGATYGGLKVLCEEAVEAALPGRALHVRAGLLVGPWDYTDRFRYWVRRLAAGGEVLVPDVPDQPLQWIDARDLAEWMVGCAEARTVGVMNATGPREATTLGKTLEGIAAALGVDPVRVRVAPGFILERGVQSWMELPLWADGAEGFLSIRVAKAFANGLRPRPLAETVRDVRDALPLEKAAADGSGITPPASLSRERETELLAAWAAR